MAPSFYDGNRMCMYEGSVATFSALSDNFHAVQTVFNGASSFPVVDGTVGPTLSPGGNGFSSPFTIGKLAGAFPLTGNIAEIRFDTSVWTTTDCANEYASQNTFWFKNAAYEGIVASRCRARASFDATNQYSNSRSAHIAAQAITALKIGFENPTGASATITASIEYPAGTFTQLKFLGSSSVTMVSGSPRLQCFSDYAAVSIPSGATFWVREFWHCTGGTYYNTWQNTFLGEATELSASSLTDKTMSGTIGNTGTPSGVSRPPVSIIGLTTKDSCAIFGDSIAVGIADTEDTSSSATGYNGVVGFLARSLDAAGVPFANYGVSATQAASQVPRLEMGKCSHMFSEFGINDFDLGSASAATLIASISAFTPFAAPFTKVYQTTVLPHTNSPNGWIAPQDQTAHNAAPQTPIGLHSTMRCVRERQASPD